MGTKILMLRLPRRPAAVVLFVMAAWILPINGQAGRYRSHVGQEGAKVVTPSIADSDAARAVEPVVRRGFDIAAAFHAAPDGVLALVQVAGVPLNGVAGRSHCALVAATTARVAAEQVFAVLDDDRAAIATALPMLATVDDRPACDDGEFAETLTAQIRDAHIDQYDAAGRTVSARLVSDLLQRLLDAVQPHADVAEQQNHDAEGNFHGGESLT